MMYTIPRIIYLQGDDKMKLTKIAAVTLAGMILLTGCGNSGLAEGTVMRVGDVNVGAGLFKAGYKSIQNASQGEETDKEEAKKQAIEDCTTRYEIVAVAHAKHIELSDELKEDMENYKKQITDYYANIDGGFEGFLENNDLTEADLDLDLSVAYYADMLMDDEMRTYFKEHYRRAKHVLISTENTSDEEAKAKAEDILERAKNGEDFDQLIKDNGEDPGMEQNPDGYYFTDGQMVQEFQDGVDSIQPGEFTLVKTNYGYHVIQRLEMNENDESYENAFSEVRYDISAAIGSDRFNELIEQWVKEENIKVTKDDAAIDKACEEAENELAEAKAEATETPADSETEAEGETSAETEATEAETAETTPAE